MKSRISAISYVLPSSKLTNNHLSKLFPDWSIEKISAKTGIDSRYISASDQYSLELAEEAAKKLFSEHNICPDVIDYIILCTQTPKYLIPTSACILQKKLGLRNEVGAFDLNLGCSGYIYCLSIANGLIQSKQAKSILALTADTYTKLIEPQNRQLRSIFGDGASATLIEACQEGVGIQKLCFYTDGAGFDKLISPMSGLRGLSSGKTYKPDLNMVGPDIFNFTIKCIPNLVDKTLQLNKLEKSNIQYCIFHQANEYMLSYLKEKSGFNDEQFVIDLANSGNTVSSSIPMALSRLYAIDKKNITSTQLLVGFGVGLSCAACVIA
jgi:3-oxoacyl-[acyl-carrier-protein] synthase-3